MEVKKKIRLVHGFKVSPEFRDVSDCHRKRLFPSREVFLCGNRCVNLIAHVYPNTFLRYSDFSDHVDFCKQEKTVRYPILPNVSLLIVQVIFFCLHNCIKRT